MLHSVNIYPAFRLLLIGTLGTNTAFWMYQVAVGWLALEMTDSPFFVGLSGFVSGIPLLLISLPAGVLIDRYDCRIVLLLAQAGVVPEPVYGGQLQDMAIPGVAPEGRVRVAYDTRTEHFADGFAVELRQPRLQIDQLGYGALHQDTLFSALGTEFSIVTRAQHGYRVQLVTARQPDACRNLE